MFVSLEDARRKIEQWGIAYNQERPHSSLDYLTPHEFAARHSTPTGSADGARTAVPAKLRPAGAVRRADRGSKTRYFFARPLSHEGRDEKMGKKEETDRRKSVTKTGNH